jgi:hypothetical protein
MFPSAWCKFDMSEVLRRGANAVFVQLIFIATTDLLLLILNYPTSLILKKIILKKS